MHVTNQNYLLSKYPAKCYTQKKEQTMIIQSQFKQENINVRTNMDD